MSNTAISSGALLRRLLLDSKPLAPYVGNKIFPIVATEETGLPYIAYRFAGLECRRLGGPAPSARDKPTFEVTVYSVDYDQGTAIAEDVRRALVYGSATIDGETLSHFQILNYTDGWSGDCFYHQLTVQASTNTIINP